MNTKLACSVERVHERRERKWERKDNVSGGGGGGGGDLAYGLIAMLQPTELPSHSTTQCLSSNMDELPGIKLQLDTQLPCIHYYYNRRIHFYTSLVNWEHHA